MSAYDVFFSFGGHNRSTVRRIAEALRNDGLRVFVDEDITVAEPVTATIEQALRSSKVFLVYYSSGYPSRPACQFELTAAFLAGQRQGDPTRRIVVINPEAETDHIHPVELADAKFLRPPMAGDRKAMAALVGAVRARVDAVSDTFGEVRFTDRPRWFADRPAGVASFIGRYREQWALHTVLHQGEYPLIRQVTSAPAVALLGIAGSGKPTLAAVYGWQFGAVFPGGVFWTSLTGATALDVLARYGDELRRVARMLRLDVDVDRAGRAELLAAVADRIFTTGRPAVWVVDDLPADLDRRTVEQLVLPAGPRLHTILISRQGSYDEFMPTVELDRMSLEDAHLLLRSHREPDAGDDDAAALEALAARLGGHPFSLRLAGDQLRHRQSMRSYADYVRQLAADPTILDPATYLIREIMDGLDDRQRLVLQVATACAPTAVPAKLITRVVTSVRPTGSDVGDALIGLRELLLATRTDDRG